MKSFRKANRTLGVLVGLGAISCALADDGSYDLSGSGEPVDTETQEFNPGPPTASQPYKGHHEMTKRAMLYLAQRGLLPATLASAANQNLVLYGNEFGDHSWLGRPENPYASVPTRQTANRAMYSSDRQTFQFEIPNSRWEDPDVNTEVLGRVGWYGKGSEWQNPDGLHPENVNPRMAQAALHYQLDLKVSVDVWADWFTKAIGEGGDVTEPPNKQDHTMDNLFHYALGSVRDYGISGLPADATTLKVYPFTAEDVAKDAAEWAAWDADHRNVAAGLAARLVNQPLMQGAEFGGDKYGAILYQLARKFFIGSRAEPLLSDLQKAGNTVAGWRTGSMRGTGVLGPSVAGISVPGCTTPGPLPVPVPGCQEMTLTFPHTYLGGNPNICNGSGADPCATGTPTWPIWVPTTAPTASTLSSMENPRPGRSDRVAHIYLGWATHFMQDLAAPHHAANWTGKQHELQDSLGDTAAYWTPTPGQEQYFMDTFTQSDVDTLLGPASAPKTRAQICSTVGVTDGQIVTSGTNWSAVRPLFLAQAKNAYQIRKASGATVADGAVYVKNAILGTMKLLLCAAPSSVPTVGYQNETSASAFVWANWPEGSYVADNAYAYTSSTGNTTANANHSITNLGTGQYRVDFTGVGNEGGGNVQATAYGHGSDRCKVAGWGHNGKVVSAWINCHDVAGQPVNTLFTASYHRRAGATVSGETGGYLWANQPTTDFYTPSPYYQYNSAAQKNTIQRLGTGSYYVVFNGTSVNGGLVEVTAYGSGSEYCNIGYWGSNTVQVNCYANGGVPADSMFTLNFTDKSPIGTSSYQYAWASDPWSANYTPEPFYQKGAIASCQPDAGTVTIQRQSTGNYIAILPKISPTGSNVKVSAYSSAGTCKVVGWWGNSPAGTQVNVACFDPAGNPADSYFDLVYASRTYIIC